MGRAHGREDRAAHRARAARTSCRSSGSSTRPAPASPTRSSCSRAAAARAASSTTRCGCRAGCRRSAACSARRPPAARTSRVLRRRDHGRGQRLDVPRLAAHGRDGDRREDDARGDGRRPHARHRVGLRRQPGRRRRRRHRPGQGLVLATSRRRGASEPPALRSRPRRSRALTADVVPDEETPGLRHARRDRRRWSTPRSFFEVKPLFAPGADRRASAGSTASPVGIVANNPMHKGGVLFVDSADKAARFIWCCDAFNVPLVFLADVPGFMIGTAGRARRASSATAPR